MLLSLVVLLLATSSLAQFLPAPIYDFYRTFESEGCGGAVYYLEAFPHDDACVEYCGNGSQLLCNVTWENRPGEPSGPSGRKFTISTHKLTDTTCTGYPISFKMYAAYGSGACILHSFGRNNNTKYTVTSTCSQTELYPIDDPGNTGCTGIPLQKTDLTVVTTCTDGVRMSCNPNSFSQWPGIRGDPTPEADPNWQPEPEPAPAQPEPEPEPTAEEPEPEPTAEEPEPEPTTEEPEPEPTAEEPQPEPTAEEPEPEPTAEEPEPEPTAEEPEPEQEPAPEPTSEEPAPEPRAPTTDELLENIAASEAAISSFLTTELTPPSTVANLGEPTQSGNFVTWVIGLVFDDELDGNDVNSVLAQIKALLAAQLGTDESKINLVLTLTSNAAKRSVQAFSYDATATISGATTMIASALMSLLFLALFI